MPKIVELKIYKADLPFRKPFKHAAAERTSSNSLFLKCKTDAGAVGFGECLPRKYVTGETRKGVFNLLKDSILPRLLGLQFNSFEEVRNFLSACDGKAPADWVPPDHPQTAAWCAVDLALLDALGKAFGKRVWLNENRTWPHPLRYSPVISSDAGLTKLLAVRLLRFPQVKVKVEKGSAVTHVRRVRKILGKRCDIRIDANMTWTPEEALAEFPSLLDLGVKSCEQPVSPQNTDGLAMLTRESKMGIMVDESLNDRDSLALLIRRKACDAVNVRVSKCGGLTASYNRCRESLEAGLVVQIGCQVGESSLLSSAHMTLTTAVAQVDYVEGCFGRYLLRVDPVKPMLMFRPGGHPPSFPSSPGLGVMVNERTLEHYSSRVFCLR